MFEFKGKQYKIKNTELLYFQRRGVESIEELKVQSEFKNIKYMYLNGNLITEITGLERFTELRVLHIRNNQLTRISGLNNLINLSELHLDCNHINRIENLDSLINLEELNLSNNSINKIENLDHLNKLKNLNLNHNNISKIENLDKLERLETLSLNTNPITKIENLHKLRNLKKLILQTIPINHIEGLSKLKKLEHLHIEFNNLDKKKIKLEGFEHLTNLKYVKLNLCKFNYYDVPIDVYVDIFRFACMIKADNYKSIEDWIEVFKSFPSNFEKFYSENSLKTVKWFINQCSPNLITIINKILEDPEYLEISKNQENYWKHILNLVNDIFTKN